MNPNNEIKKIGSHEGFTNTKDINLDPDELLSGHKVWQNGDSLDEDNYGKIYAI
jgi:hypothetical protein